MADKMMNRQKTIFIFKVNLRENVHTNYKNKIHTLSIISMNPIRIEQL